MSHDLAQKSPVLDLDRLSVSQLVGSCPCERDREGNKNTQVQVLLLSMPDVRSSPLLATSAYGTKQQDRNCSTLCRLALAGRSLVFCEDRSLRSGLSSLANSIRLARLGGSEALGAPPEPVWSANGSAPFSGGVLWRNG